MDTLAEAFGFSTGNLPDPDKKPRPEIWILVAVVGVIFIVYVQHNVLHLY